MPALMNPMHHPENLLPHPTQLLPGDGEAWYFGPVMPAAAAAGYFEALMQEITWQHDEVVMFGKRIVTARMVAWYGSDTRAYTYARTTRHALPWTPTLLAIKAITEAHTGASYNACLLNRYHHGGEGMSWHRDNEPEIVPRSSIASVSLGAERKFAFKHRHTGETVSCLLAAGSLLEMKGDTQTHWLHSLPKMARITAPRINLTFREMR
jgi:alkylated DNA repair dioxygenase AlkB